VPSLPEAWSVASLETKIARRYRKRNRSCAEQGSRQTEPSPGNFIARNTCAGNLNQNWSIVADNKCLVINGTNAPAITGNSGGTSPGSTSPYANFTY
jgi:hypothetical protein